MSHSKHPPIAIVGIGCRMPGGVQTPEDFWKVIHDGTNTIIEVPPDRWCIDNFYHPDQTKQGKMITRRCGFIDKIDQFDNTFFKISPREAMSMDPQQRHILEVVHEAFEDAGIVPETANETTGVFVGIGLMDYPIQSVETSIIDAYTVTGAAHSVAANRISYAFDLKGPSYAVDTACASSMTAMHLACHSIWSNECTVAVLGGCNNLLLPDVTVGFSALGVLSPEGQCCPFSSSAKGYVRSEGFGALILKGLDRAVADNDHIYAVIRGSAIAANGFSNSLTMPSQPAQVAVMQEAYRRHDIPLSSVYCIEAHGTGTPVGDPIEAEAIGKTFAPHHDTPLRIGSCKSNFGHNECAAGVTAAIKVALMLDKRMLVPTINYVDPNPHIKMDEWKLQVQTKVEPFPEDNRQTIIGLNSFGFAGALAHMIFQEAPTPQKTEVKPPCLTAEWRFGGAEKGNNILIPLSAKSTEALAAVANDWKNFNCEDKDALTVVSWLSTRRKHHECRLAVISNSGEGFQKQLGQFVSNGAAEGISSGSSYGEKPKICMVFPGQGQQWGNMGRQLYKTEKVFRDALQECDEIFKDLSGWSLLNDKLFFNGLNGVSANGVKLDADKLINEIEISQPAILFFQIGIFRLYQSWGVSPDVVVGHSLGEVAAAYACGGLTLEEAVEVIYHRSTQQALVKGAGSMAALRMSLEEAQKICSKSDSLYVAAINAPAGITIAGDTQLITDFAKNNPTIGKQLRVQCAFHTPEMDPMEKSFRAAMEGAVKTEPGCRTIPFYSTVTGELYKGDFGTEYWWDNIRNTVQFQPAIESILAETEANLFLECGSSATLISSVNQIAKKGRVKANVTSIASGQRQQDDRFMALKALGSLYTAGVLIDWKNVTGDCAEWVSLPKYPWQRQTFWLESEPMRKTRLGLDDRTFKGQSGVISLRIFPSLADHIVQDRLVFPGAGYVEYTIETSFTERELPALSHVSFCKLLMWPEEMGSGGTKFSDLKLSCSKEGSKIEVTSAEEGTVYSTAEIDSTTTINEHIPLGDILSRCSASTTGESFYAKMATLGLGYGPAFQVVEEIAVGDGEVLGYLKPVASNHERLKITHLDGCFQLLISAIGDTSTLYLPVAIKSLKMHVPTLPTTEPLVAHVTVTECDSMTLTGNITMATGTGQVLMTVEGCQCQNVLGTSSDVALSSCLYTTEKQVYRAALPPISEAAKIFEPSCLEQLFPEEMDPIAQAVALVPVLRSVCVSYIRDALDVVPADERKKCNIRYLRRLEVMAADTSIPSIPLEDIPNCLKEILDRIPDFRQEIDMITNLSNNMVNTLRDPATAVPILFAPENVAHYFIDSLSTRLYYKTTAKMVEDAVKEAIKHKGVVTILEVGGRMGGLSSYVLESLRQLGLDKRVEYIFTDLSASFFAHAQGRLNDYPFVKYQQLDIEADVVSQGFIEGSVDIVICMDTLHAVVDIHTGLGNMRNLLSPDGWLVMIEVTNSQCMSEFIFGALELCWVFNDFRKDVCWLTRQGWAEVMKEGGFSDVIDVSSPNEFFHSIFVGRKSERVFSPIAHRSDYTVLVDKTFSGSGNVLRHLKAQNTTYLSSEVSIADTFKDRSEPVHLVYIISKSDWKAQNLARILKEVHAAEPGKFSKISIITSNSKMDTAVAVGLIRAATNQCLTPIVSYLLEDETEESLMALVENILPTSDIKDREITIKAGEVLVPRLLKSDISDHDPKDYTYWQLTQCEQTNGKSASIDDMGFSYLSELDPLPGKVVVKVKATALNFKDVMMSLGLLSGLDEGDERDHFGIECSGIVEKVGAGVVDHSVGDEVIGFGKHCFASHTVSDSNLLVRKPARISWVESAGITVVFATAYHSLVQRANLQRDETVLIHSACGGVGLAAIQVARMVGAKIICSAGSDRKKSYLRKELGIELVTDSRSGKFYDDIMTWTDGAGVDVVLNSLSGNLLLKGIECLAFGGRFCEIGKRDILQKTNLLIMPLILENKSILSCQIDRIVRHQKTKAQQLLQKVTSLFDEGVLKPIVTQATPITEFAQTFRYVAKASHIGKLVFDIPSYCKPTPVLPTSMIFKVNATYIVTGGHGGLGQAFVRWLCKKGARHIALVSRGGCRTASARRTAAFMRRKGTKVYDFALDVADASNVQTMLRRLQQEHNAPVVRGIFHLAGFIAEESLAGLTPDLMDRILGAKASGARHLHNLTWNLPLDFFVMASSVIAAWGHSSQPCYTAANVYLDELAEKRISEGLPATSLQLGPVRGAGYLESNPEVVKTLAMKGHHSLHVEEVLQVVGQILQAKESPAVICLANQDWDATLLHCHNDSLRFRHLTLGKQVGQTDCSLSQDDLEERVRQKMGQLLCVEPASIDLRQPMINYGIDSLMAVEMVTWASKELSVVISQLDILGGICTSVLLDRALDNSVVINVAE